MKVLVQETLVDCFSPDKLVMLGHFVDYCARGLHIEHDVHVIIVDNRQKYEIETTAQYEPDRQIIFVYGKGRSFVDVMKSISHEMVHVKQYEVGFIDRPYYLHFHSELEDDANVEGMSLLNAYTDVMGRDLIYDN
jgi:hypothetical protein